MELEGGCYCGALRYRAEGDPLFRVQCHCRECQYVSGGAPTLVLGMPEAGFSYTQGEAKTFQRSDLEDAVTREFCPECGTHTAGKRTGMPVALIKVGTLDDPSVFGGPDMVIYTCDQQSFHLAPEGVPTFEHTPG